MLSKITYVSQAQGDRLILADTNGWTWLGLQQDLSAGAGDLGIPQPDGKKCIRNRRC